MSNEKQPVKDIFDESIENTRLRASVQAEKDQYKKDLKDASIAAMNGILAYTGSGYKSEVVANDAIDYAKALLKRLEEERK